jgi:hypothetical protein
MTDKVLEGLEPSSDLVGVCHSIKDGALAVVEGLGATIGMFEEAIEEVCDGNCLVCPVELRRRGVNVVMTYGHTVVFGITSGWQNLVDAISAQESQDS